MDKPISRFELLIAFGNCLVWFVAAYALFRRFREKRHLREAGAIQGDTQEEVGYQAFTRQEFVEWTNAQLAMMKEEEQEENARLWEELWRG